MNDLYHPVSHCTNAPTSCSSWTIIETPDDTLERYDIQADPQELHHLASSQPGLVDQLRGMMKERG